MALTGVTKHDPKKTPHRSLPTDPRAVRTKPEWLQSRPASYTDGDFKEMDGRKRKKYTLEANQAKKERKMCARSLKERRKSGSRRENSHFVEDFVFALSEDGDASGASELTKRPPPGMILLSAAFEATVKKGNRDENETACAHERALPHACFACVLVRVQCAVVANRAVYATLPCASRELFERPACRIERSVRPIRRGSLAAFTTGVALQFGLCVALNLQEGELCDGSVGLWEGERCGGLAAKQKVGVGLRFEPEVVA
ncbi:hypothetical protein MRX96_042598 [Rhipicephalus microplus]